MELGRASLGLGASGLRGGRWQWCSSGKRGCREHANRAKDTETKTKIKGTGVDTMATCFQSSLTWRGRVEGINHIIQEGDWIGMALPSHITPLPP